MPISNARRNAAVVVAGLVVLLALTLRWESARHTITGLASRCTISETIDCDKVQASNYASVLGVPLSVWAAAGHLILIGWLLDGQLVAAGILAAFHLCLALFLAYISFFRLHAVCLYCSAIQIGIVALAVLLVPPARRAGSGAGLGRTGLGRTGLIASLLVLLAFSGEAYARQRSELLRHYQRGKVPQYRVDVAGSPILGDPTTPYSGLLYLDFGCPACRNCYRKARQLVKAHPDQVHIIIKHYPLDSRCNRYEKSEFHKGACHAARACAAASLRGEGPRAMRYLFEKAPDFWPQVLEDLGKVIRVPDLDWKDPHARAIVLRDIDDGHALKFNGVPQGFLNGRPRDPSRIDKWIR